MLSAGDRFTCGLTVEGQAYCWGDDAGYKLGTSEILPLTGSAVPAPVAN